MNHSRHSMAFLILVFATAFSGIICCGGCTKDPDPEPLPFVRFQEDLMLDSKLLNFPVRFNVLLPADYDSTSQSYPVVYLLHGFGDSHTSWYTGGRILYYSDRSREQNGSMIFVMPQGFNSYYVNKYNGNAPYMDMFTRELVPAIDSIYRTKKDKSQRAVMGFSMGGFGALVLPALNPDIFTISVPLSMSFRTDEQYMSQSQDGWNSQFGSVFGGYGSVGEQRLTDHFKAHSPFHFFNRDDVSDFSGLKIFLDCGDDEESLHITNGRLHELLAAKGISHEYRVRNGGHSWDYWHESLPEALKYIGYGFKGIDFPDEPDPLTPAESINPGQYRLIDLHGSELQIGVFEPESYQSVADSFPVIFFFHDFEESRAETTLKALSFLNSKMKKSALLSSLVIEIPCNAEEISASVFADIQSMIFIGYRALNKKKSRIFIGSGKGGETAIKLLAENHNSINACFIFNSGVSGENIHPSDVFYYIDITDKANDYSSGFNLFLELKETDTSNEFRVRQGSESIESFINGINESISDMAKYLKK